MLCIRRYKEGGPAAVTNFDAGVAGFEARAFRGCGVVTSDPFDVAEDSEAVQMLQRFTQVGEYYVMKKPITAGKDQPGFMNIMIYDEELDRHVLITYEAALIATGVFAVPLNDNGTSGYDLADGFDGTTALDDGTTLNAWGLAAKALNDASKGGSAIPAKDAPVVIARPFIEHAMLSAVLTVSGADTGATIFGPSDMQISANTSVKTIEGHYTGHFKAVVYKPQNVFVMRDIMANGYRAGGNTKFFAPDGDLSKAKTAMTDRLNFDDEATQDDMPASMLAFPASATWAEKGLTEMSVTSRLLSWEVNDKKHSSFPGGEDMYKLYNPKLMLEQVHFGEDLRASENMEYMSQGSVNNSLCFLGPHRVWDGIKKAYVTLVPGMGHWGPDARPGVSCTTFELLHRRNLTNVLVCAHRTRAGAAARPCR